MEKNFDQLKILSLPLLANLAIVAEDNALWLLSSTNASSVERLQNDQRCAVEIVQL